MNSKMIAVSLLLSASLSTGLGEEIECPDSIPVKQELSKPIAGWESVEQQTNPSLDQIAVYLHHPNEKGSLVPDSDNKRKGHELVTWKFLDAKEEHWVACTYHDTNVMLAKKLSASFQQCIADYTLLPSGSRLKLSHFRCK